MKTKAAMIGALAILALMSTASAASAASTIGNFCILAVEETSGTFAMIDPQGQLLKRLTLGERPHEVEVSPDGATAFVSMFGITDYDSRLGSPGLSVARIDLAQAKRVGDYRLPADVRAPHGVKLRPPRFHELFVNTEVGGESMLVFDSDTYQLLRRFPLPPGSHNFVFTADGAALFVFAGAKGVTKLDATTGQVLATRDLGSPVRGLAMAPSGSVLASIKGAVVELRAADLSEIRRLRAPRDGQFVYLDPAPDGTIVAPSLTDGGVAIFAAEGRAPSFIATGKTPIRALHGPDGLVYVANVEDDHITVLGPDGALRRTISGVTSPNGINFGHCPGPVG